MAMNRLTTLQRWLSWRGSLDRRSRSGVPNPYSDLRVMLLVFCASAGLTACRTPSRLPPVDLAEPGWRVHQGQASWRPRAETGELVGDIVVATHEDGRALLQFSKTPLPLIAAQIHGNQWELRHIPQQRVINGSGPPPSSAIWLHVPAILEGAAPPRPLESRQVDQGAWNVSNPITGETLTLYLNP